MNKFNATVQEIRKIHNGLMILRIKPDNPIREHLPGQYTTLGMMRCDGSEDCARLVRRSYSISCPILGEYGTDWLEFYIALVPEGTLTPKLFTLKEGSRLHMGEKIVGNYTLKGVPDDANIVFLSTGTGEAPHNYMLWELLKKKHKGKITLVSCVRKNIDLAYKEVHEKLKNEYEFVALTTRESNAKVYIQDYVNQTVFDKNTHFFLCGNPAMIGAKRKVGSYPVGGTVEILEKKGLNNIHLESYW